MPPWIVGSFERLLAFVLVMLTCKAPTLCSPFGLEPNLQRVGIAFR